MSSLVIFFVVVLAIVGPQNVMASISIKDIDVDRLLELVQQQRGNRAELSDSSDSDDSDDSDSSSDEVGRSGKVRGDNLVEIISQVVNSKNNRNNFNRKNRYDRASHERAQKYSNRNSNNLQRSSSVAQILEQLFNNGFKEVDPRGQSYKRSPKKRLTPNRLLGGEVKSRTSDDGIEDYSKIFVLLNPQALQRSKDSKSGVNKMISRILSLSSPLSKREAPKQKQNRYKGFAIKGDIGRRRGSREHIEEHRKSNSVFAPKSSIENQPKRNRNSGGGTGHTAIPYIRHRGENIYERDN